MKKLGSARIAKLAARESRRVRPAAAILPLSHDLTNRTRLPEKLETVGDHIRRRRLTLKLLQRQVAQQLGVNEVTVTNWETNGAQPILKYMPGDHTISRLQPATAAVRAWASDWSDVALPRSCSTHRGAADVDWVRAHRYAGGAAGDRERFSVEEVGDGLSGGELAAGDAVGPGDKARTGARLLVLKRSKLEYVGV